MRAAPMQMRAAPMQMQVHRPAHDIQLEETLDAWVEAKKAKDFPTADALRAELRNRGVDPDKARPFGSAPCKGSEIWVEDQLDAWVDSKRGKRYAEADRIRDELRAMGVDPDQARP